MSEKLTKKLTISLPELIAVGATRGMIGVGAGFILSNLVSRKTRKRIGIPLFAIGLLSTIPIATRIFHKGTPADTTV
jgi:hypothetical protein